MDLVIARSEGIVSIDNQPLAVDTSPLASNIELLAYDCTNGAGNLEYNDRLRVLEPFGDITPYAAFVNSWMTTAAAITAMPLTLAQAKRVKVGLVDGIFNSKRQLPITTQGQTWDATDQSLLGMQAAVASFNIEAQVNGGLNGLAGSVNAMGIYTSTQTSTSTSTSTQTQVGAPGYTAVAVDAGGHPNSVIAVTPPLVAPNAASQSQSNSSSSSQSSSSHDSVSAPNVIPPSIPWPPLNSTTSVNLSTANMRALINSIQQRRGSLQSTRLAKTNAINSMTTVAAIIAYDATTGWPF